MCNSAGIAFLKEVLVGQKIFFQSVQMTKTLRLVNAIFAHHNLLMHPPSINYDTTPIFTGFSQLETFPSSFRRHHFIYNNFLNGFMDCRDYSIDLTAFRVHSAPSELWHVLLVNLANPTTTPFTTSRELPRYWPFD